MIELIPQQVTPEVMQAVKASEISIRTATALATASKVEALAQLSSAPTALTLHCT